MKKFKIALCIEYPILQHGGVEVLIRGLILGLHKDFDLYLVSDDSQETVESSGVGAMLKGWIRYSPAATKKIGESQRLIEWGKEKQIDLFHFHHGGTYAWGSRSLMNCPITRVSAAGFRCVTTNHGAFSIFNCVGTQRSLLFKLAALCVCWPAKLNQIRSVEWEATVSKSDLNDVRRWFFPLSRKFVHIYHSILDGNEQLNETKDKIVLCLGTIGARKGQQYLAEAFGMISKEHPDWRLVIAGRHAHVETSRKIYEAIELHGIKDRVVILKDVPDDQAVELVRSAAIFAMPSLAEGLGLSLQEGMFRGAACIASDAGGITDMLEDGHTGLLTPPADPVSLSRGLVRLIRDPALRARLGEQGRKSIIAKGMTRQEMCEKHLALYNKVLIKD